MKLAKAVELRIDQNLRVKLADNDLNRLFQDANSHGYTVGKIAVALGVSRRTVFDWKRGKYLMTKASFHSVVHLSRRKDIEYETVVDGWHRSAAGKKGSQRRTELYGPLGTPEGRKKGGLSSYRKHRRVPGSVYTIKEIRVPAKGALLAEAVGIIIGDGGITKYQLVITTSLLVDAEYSLVIKQLFEELFGLKVGITERKASNCIVIRCSSVRLIKFLETQGLKTGNKLVNGLDIPKWIMLNNKYKAACLRGIFDTDGGIYNECHKIKSKIYCYPRMAFVSASPTLRVSIHKALKELDFNPKIRNNRSVNIENIGEIKRYFNIVGSSNPKHLKRFAMFGGVG